MSKKKEAEKPARPMTANELRIAEIRRTPRALRQPGEVEELARLMAVDKRDRFVRVMPKRIERLKSAVRNVVRMGAPTSYQYTDDEAVAIVAAVKRYATEVERAFRGTPSEKGLFDL